MDLPKALESFKSIKLTGGIFGKTTLLLIALVLGVSVVVIKLSVWWVALSLFLPVIALSGYTIKRCFDFAEQHPQAAIMDGAELLHHERLIHEQKGGLKIIDDPPVVDHEILPISPEEFDSADPPAIESGESIESFSASERERKN